MAASRYWRLVGISTSGNSLLELSEARIYENGVLADAGATLSATLPPASGALSDLRDGLITGVVAWPHSSYARPGFALLWDFGGGGVAYPNLLLGSGSGSSTWLQDGTLQCSSDNQTWVTYLSGLVGISYPGAYALTATPSASGSGVSASVPDASSVLLLSGNGPDGSKSIADTAPLPKAITAIGNTCIKTTEAKFGGSSIYFDGSDDWISTPNSGDFSFGIGDFTVALWVFIAADSLPSGNGLRRASLVSTFPASGGVNSGWYLALSASTSTTGTGLLFDYFVGGSEAYVYDQSHPITKNAWHHIAVTRSGSAKPQLWLDGQDVGGAAAGNVTGEMTSSAAPDLRIGGLGHSYETGMLNGYISDLHISKGIARYSANFTPGVRQGGGAVIKTDTYANRTTCLTPPPERFLPATSLPDSTAQGHLREMPFFDAYNGGIGIIYGTIKEKHTPANTPLRRKILLLDEGSQVVIRATWSNAVTGNYEFRGVKEGVTYTVLSYDHTGAYRAVVADHQIPELIV